jgi:hypothetical protein
MRTPSRPIVVVDVSPAAAGLWPVLHSTLEGLAEVMPEAERPDVTFLGGSARVPLDLFLRNAVALHAANAGRGRVISPLLDLLHDWPARIVVMAARPVVDLADWAATPFAGRLAAVRLDPTLPISCGAFAESQLSDVASVARLLELPPAMVRLSAADALPIGWDDPRLRFDDGRLTADAGIASEWNVGFLSPAESPVVAAELVREGVGSELLPVSPCEAPEARPWLPFTSAELTILDAWRGGRPAYCARCRGEHGPGEVACPSGAWALPSLSRTPLGSFVRVRVKMFQASFQPVGPTLRLEDTAVAVRGSRPTVWRFDGEWKATGEPWGPFERIAADDEFALALPTEAPS